MQSQLVAMLILTSGIQGRGDDGSQKDPPPIRELPVIHVIALGDGSHQLSDRKSGQSLSIVEHSARHFN
jgi:hypothetical protein